MFGSETFKHCNGSSRKKSDRHNLSVIKCTLCSITLHRIEHYERKQQNLTLFVFLLRVKIWRRDFHFAGNIARQIGVLHTTA